MAEVICFKINLLVQPFKNNIYTAFEPIYFPVYCHRKTSRD